MSHHPAPAPPPPAAPAPAVAATTHNRMPFRGAHGAPTFNGTPTHLNRFFTNIEHLVSTLGLTLADDDLVKWAIYYLDCDTAEVWQPFVGIPGEADKWRNFRQRIRALYPGSEGDRLHSVKDLEHFVADSADKGVFTRSDLGNYYREFSRIATYLSTKGKIDIGLKNRLYIQGFGEVTCRRIEHRLSIISPDHHPDDPYDLADVHRAAEFLLSGTSPLTPSTTTHAASCTGVSSQVPGSFATPGSLPIKQEPSDISALSSMIAALQATVLRLTEQVNGGRNAKPTKQKNPCAMCSADEHFIKQCPHVEHYIRNGKCARNAEGRLVLPSGQYLPRNIAGKNLKEKFDEYHRQNTTPPAPSTASVNLFDVATPACYGSGGPHKGVQGILGL